MLNKYVATFSDKLGLNPNLMAMAFFPFPFFQFYVSFSHPAVSSYWVSPHFSILFKTHSLSPFTFLLSLPSFQLPTCSIPLNSWTAISQVIVSFDPFVGG